VCLSFCGTTKKPRSLEPGGGWDLCFIHLPSYISSPCTHFLCFVPLHTLLMFRPLAHTPYVSSPCTHSLCFVPLHTLLMFRPPLYFLLQPSNAKRKDGSPCHSSNLSRSQ
jgi:Rieske Fe-S protein